MPIFYLVTQSSRGSVRTLLHLQEYDIERADTLHLDAEKKHSRTIKTLLLDENLPGIKGTQPLFHLVAPFLVELEVEGLEVVRADPSVARTRVRRSLGVVSLSPIDEHDGFTVFMTTQPAEPYSVRLWADHTQYQGEFAVWRVAATIKTDRVKSMQIAGMLTASRIQFVMDSAPTRIECASCGGDKRKKNKAAHPAVAITANVCDHIDATITSMAMSDSAMLSTFHVAYSIEASHSLWATDLGHSLLTANASPAAAIQASPDLWAARAAEQIHTNELVSDAYRRDAEAFRQQLTEGVVDYFRDAWSGTVKGVKASVQRFMPSDETIAVLKAINVHKLAGRTRAALSSKTLEAVVATLTTNPRDIVYLEAWGKAVLGDLKIDESAVGQLVIDNAPAVESALRSVIAKMQLLLPKDLDDYGVLFRALIGNDDLADGVIQLARVAKSAAELAARNASKAGDAARTAAKLAAAGAGAVADSQ